MPSVTGKQKVFITVKTYPTISSKYDELVCTAGIVESGEWIRIYPSPFRKLDYEQQYRKYQWIEFDLEKNTEDVRPESYRIRDINSINPIGEPVGTEQYWHKRKEIILKKNPVYTNLEQLINQANDNILSLAVFKPTTIDAFTIEDCARQWSAEKLALLEEKAKQLSLFQSAEEVKKEFLVVDKLPYKFSYRFTDDQNKSSKMMIEDWEIGALYWNCLASAEGDEDKALAMVEKKYWTQFKEKDIHLFLGTESPRDCRRLKSLRGLANEKTTQLFTRDTGKSGSISINHRA